ncbi:MAG TPA: hypothetical protein VFW60_01845 [Rhodanobacteraceae bacterium]|nr:hypothetical protein [Rhodanobacteraceae bacterium]
MVGTWGIRKMDEWPTWQRWGTWLLGCALYAGSFWVLFANDGLGIRVVALVGLCVGLLVLTYASRAVLNERMRTVDRRYVRAVLPAFLVYIVMALYVWPLADRTTTHWLKAVLVLLPALPMVYVAWAVIRYVNRCDELERRQQLEAAGIAVVVVGLASMVLGLLAAARLIHVNGALALILVLPALCCVWGMVCSWSKWRNRAR